MSKTSAPDMTNQQIVSKYPSLISSKSTILKEIDREIEEYERDPEGYDRKKQEQRRIVPVSDGTQSQGILEPRKYEYSRVSLGLPEYIFPGISMSDIARDTGMTLGGVSRIMNGNRKARLYILKSIANLYTEGDVDRVRQIIKDRVLRRLQYDKRLTPDERNKILARIS